MNDLMSNGEGAAFQCPVTSAMKIIGGKWKLIILWCIANEINRFGMLQRTISGISKKMLASELKALESDGLIIRTDFHTKPLRVDYSLSEKSQSLYPTLVKLSEWGAKFPSMINNVSGMI